MKVICDLGVSGIRHRAPARWSPSELFQAGEPGVVFLPSPQTCFSDLAGSTPATPGTPVALLHDESGHACHASQDTISARPVFARIPATGVRNMHPYSQSNSGFAGFGTTPPIVTNDVTHFGESCASIQFDPSMAAGFESCRAERSIEASVVSGRSYASSFHVALSRALAGSEQIVLGFDGVSGLGQVILNAANSAALVEAFGRVSVVGTALASGSVTIHPVLGSTLAEPVTLFLNRVQIEEGDAPTPYQATQSLFDVSEAGVSSLHALYFDGAGHSLQTASLGLANPQAVSVFAGARKLSDASIDVLIEHGPNNVTTNGSFVLQANGVTPDKAVFASRGTQRAAAIGAFGYAPCAAVLAGLGSIGPGNAALRVNGTLVANSSVDQGVGAYDDHALYIGQRAGSALAFHGYFFGAIVRFAGSSATEIGRAETLMAARSGVILQGG